MKLICHPRFFNPAVLSIECLARRENVKLVLEYSLCGDLSRIVLPEPCAPRQADSLWRHTCFEAFVAPERGCEYYEYNFSPSGEWAVFAFSDYRKRRALLYQVREPEMTLRQTEKRLEVEMIVSLDHLPTAPLKLGLSVVIEDENGGFSYWALKHPRDEPDFHHRDSFALAI
ncbi:MAG: DOMON-like domain-containing protein [Burkholderiales bacterium]